MEKHQFSDNEVTRKYVNYTYVIVFEHSLRDYTMVGTTRLTLFAFLLGLIGCVQSESLKAPATQRASIPSPAKTDDPFEPPQKDEVPLEARALSILEQNCASCHSLDNAQGGFGTVLDIDEMIKSGRYLVPGNPAGSEIINRLAPQSNMPPSEALSDEDRGILSDWVTNIEAVEIKPLDDFTQLATIRKDLEQFLPAQRRSQRYFSLQIPNNAGMNGKTKEFMVKGLSKSLNSLSKTPLITVPTPIDERKLIFRIDLVNLGINPVLFDAVMADFYPFTVEYELVGNDPNAQRLVEDHQFAIAETQTPNYLIRTDWFNATSTLPVLYKRLLELPDTQQELEQQLGINLATNINNNLVVRSGFRNSGVSSQNRVLERHVSNANLPYWVSYDFADNNDGTQNVFNFPLGPLGSGFDAKAFDQDGGEVIFQLPNGLFGYYLAVGTGAEIHKGPTNIVRQLDGPTQFFQQILNGMSCMSCHGQGILYKKDDIKDFVTISQDFSNEEKNKVLSIYASEDQLKAVVDQDNKIYFEALLKMGIREGDPDPVNQSYRYYNKNLFRKDVLAELGVSEEILTLILNTEPFKSAWVSIFNNSGSITRQEFNLLYGQVVNIFKNGETSIASLLGDHLATPDCMVADPFFMNSCSSGFVEPAPAAQ